jgi:hypothetical protein
MRLKLKIMLAGATNRHQFTYIGIVRVLLVQLRNIVLICIKVTCGVRDRTKEYHLSLSSMDVVKSTEGLTVLITEIHCDQMAMGLPPIKSAGFLKVN